MKVFILSILFMLSVNAPANATIIKWQVTFDAYFYNWKDIYYGPWTVGGTIDGTLNPDGTLASMNTYSIYSITDYASVRSIMDNISTFTINIGPEFTNNPEVNISNEWILDDVLIQRQITILEGRGTWHSISLNDLWTGPVLSASYHVPESLSTVAMLGVLLIMRYARSRLSFTFPA